MVNLCHEKKGKKKKDWSCASPKRSQPHNGMFCKRVKLGNRCPNRSH